MTPPDLESRAVRITRDLLAVLLERAADSEPDGVSLLLTATPAGEFPDPPPELDPAAPIITHYTLPGAGGSVSAVFGMDLGTPAGRSRARFVSHPDGGLELRETDDLAAAVIVAVPPWEPDCVAAFDRSGRELPLWVVDAAPPEESVPGGP